MKINGNIWKAVIPLFFALLFAACFSPLMDFDDNEAVVTVSLSGGSETSRAVCFHEDEGNTSIESGLIYAVKFTNTATGRIVDAEISINGSAVNAVAVINPGVWKIDGTADIKGTPPVAYAIGTVTENIQQSTTIYIPMKRAVRVDFESNGGSEVESQIAADGGLISKPGNPVKTGLSFNGWYTDDGIFNEPWNFDSDTVSVTPRTKPDPYAQYEFRLYANWIFVPVTGITLTSSSTATIGTPLVLSATVQPENASYQTIVWSVISGGTGSATISGATLNPTITGTVNIRATIVNGTAVGTDFTRDFTITINPAGVFVPVTGITLTSSSTATIGTPLVLSATVSPANATNTVIAWSNLGTGTGSATLNGATLNPTAPGTVNIRATITNGIAVGTNFTRDFTITINPAGVFVPVTGITLTSSSTATIGTPLVLSATVSPVNATNTAIVWSIISGGTGSATLIDATLNPAAAGTIKIRATITNGTAVGTDFTKDFTITVNQTGSGEVAFEVLTVEDLLEVGRHEAGDGTQWDGWTLSASYIQMDDIDLYDMEVWDYWEPIGGKGVRDDEPEKHFTGTYDGGGNSIDNLDVNNEGRNSGMFAYISAAGVVKNVTLNYFTIAANILGGGIAGTNEGTIQDCEINNGSVGALSQGGGIAGNNSGLIKDCFINNTYIITTNNDAGGIAGFNTGTVDHCISYCDINTGQYNAGGIVGYNEGTIKDCAHLSGHNVYGEKSFVGGIAGCNIGSESLIERCYSQACVASREECAGGIAGYNEGTIRNCNWSCMGDVQFGVIAGYDDSDYPPFLDNFAGGIAGSNTGTIEYCYTTSNSGANDYSGGITGYTNGTVQYCVSVGMNYVNASGYVGRIAGKNEGTMLGNYSDSEIYADNLEVPDPNPIGKDGENCNYFDYEETSWWTGTLHWDPAIWNFEDYYWPILRSLEDYLWGG